MTKITVSTSATESRIKEATDKAIRDIKTQANRGNNTTELLIDKDIASEVRGNLLKMVEGINFLVVRTGSNPYTGRTEHFSSETIGDMRYYKVMI